MRHIRTAYAPRRASQATRQGRAQIACRSIVITKVCPLSQIDADYGPDELTPRETGGRDEFMPVQQNDAGAAVSADAAAADSADGSPEQGDSAEVQPVAEEEPIEEEPADRDGSAMAAAETGSAAGDEDNEDDIQALDAAEDGATEDNSEQPQQPTADAELVSRRAERIVDSESEPSGEEAAIIDVADVASYGSPADGKQLATEDELLEPVPAPTGAELQINAEQPDATSVAASDAVVAAAEDEPSSAEGSAVLEEGVSMTEVTAATEAAADEGESSTEGVLRGGAQEPVVPHNRVPAWRRAHDEAAEGDVGGTLLELTGAGERTCWSHP